MMDEHDEEWVSWVRYKKLENEYLAQKESAFINKTGPSDGIFEPKRRGKI